MIGWRRTIPVWLFTVFVLLSIAAALETTNSAAQGSQQVCSRLLAQVTDQLAKSCNGLSGDQACYVNPALKVDYQSVDTAQQPQPSFAKPGDMLALSAIKAIRADALNTSTGEWGIAVLKLRVGKLPAVNDQLVTFIVYGDTTLTPSADAPKPLPEAALCPALTSRTSSQLVRPIAGSPIVQQIPGDLALEVYTRAPDSKWLFAQFQGKSGWLPAENVKLGCDLNGLPEDDPAQPVAISAMSTFSFSSAGSASSSCSDIPAGGLLIDSPNGRAVNFSANGVNMTLRSAVLLQAQPNDAMDVTVLRGEAELSYQTDRRVVAAGNRLSIPLNGLQASGPFTATRQIDLRRDVQGNAGLCQVMRAANVQSELCGPITAQGAAQPTQRVASTSQARVTFTPTLQSGVVVLPQPTAVPTTAAPPTVLPTTAITPSSVPVQNAATLTAPAPTIATTAAPTKIPPTITKASGVSPAQPSIAPAGGGVVSPAQGSGGKDDLSELIEKVRATPTPTKTATPISNIPPLGK